MLVQHLAVNSSICRCRRLRNRCGDDDGGLRVDGDQRRRVGDAGQRIERNRKRHGEVQRRGKYQRVRAFGDADDCG